MTKNEDEVKISRTNATSSIIIYLFFTILISIGLYNSKNDILINPLISISLISFIFFLIYLKFNLWSISKRNETLIFKRLLSRKNYEINILEDLVDVDCEVYTEIQSSIIHYALILKTSKNNFKLSSQDYRNFDELLLEIFRENKSYLNDFNRLKKTKKRKAKNTDKTILIILIIVFIIFAILYK